MPNLTLWKSAKRRLVRDRIVDPSTGCWLWKGLQATSERYGHEHLGRTFQIDAHRLSYMLFVGPIPLKLWVLHRCDVKPCFNPSHLYLGTRKDNFKDMTSKGRHYNQKKKECPQGHRDWAVLSRGPTRQQRYCRTCDNARKRLAYANSRLNVRKYRRK